MPELTPQEPQEPVNPQVQEPPQNAAPPEDDADLNEHVIEVPANALPQKGEKVVKFGALKSERDARKAESAARKAAEEKAARLEQQMGQVAPILQALQGRQDIVAALQSGQPLQPNNQPQEDTEAKEYAEALGLYNHAGELDIARGRKALDIAEKRAAKVVQTQVAPLRQSTAQTTANAVRQALYQAADKDGNVYATRESIDELMGAVDPTVLTQEMAVHLLQNAIGRDRVLGRTAPRRPEVHEPLFTEAPGGRSVPRTQQPTSDFERMAMERMGISEKDWNNLTAATEKKIYGR